MMDSKLDLQIQLLDLFNEIDINGDGNVGILELKTWLFRHGLDENDDDVY
jgi:Ca2+-binding EF-hand superfamily protein